MPLLRLWWFFAYDDMARREVRVMPAANIVYRMECYLGAGGASRLGGASSRWSDAWRDATRHGVLREFGFLGFFDTADADGLEIDDEMDLDPGLADIFESVMRAQEQR